MKTNDLRLSKNTHLDERSIMEKLLTEYQDIAYDEIKKFTMLIEDPE